MKKQVLIASLIALAAVATAMQDGLAYWVVALMGLAVLGALQLNRKRFVRITRWAKANPFSAQGFIAGIQLILMGLGLYGGYNLSKLDYRFSDVTAYVFSIVIAVGFLSVHFWPRRQLIVLPREVDRQRLVYLGISLASLMMVAFFGNRVAEVYPDAPITRVLEKIDQSVFAPLEPETVSEKAWTGQEYREVHPLALAGGSVGQPLLATLEAPSRGLFSTESVSSKTALKKASKAERKTARKADKRTKQEIRRQYRMAAAGGICVAAVFLILLLIAPLCAGICLFAFGIADTSILALILGPIIAAASIWGMVACIKWCKRNLDKSDS